MSVPYHCCIATINHDVAHSGWICGRLSRYSPDQAAEAFINTIYLGSGQDFLEATNEPLGDRVRPHVADIGVQDWRYDTLACSLTQHEVEELIC
jgi:hypothetical protein